jgi:hypothetical protein
MPTNNMFGVASNAYWFGLSNSAIYVPAATVNNLASGTISAWLQLDANNRGAVFGKQHSGVSTMALLNIGIDHNGNPINPGQIFFRGSNAGSDAYSANYLTTNVWYQIVVAFSPSNCDIYINGILSTNVAGNFSIPDDLNPTATTMGSWLEDTHLVSLQGKLTDIRVYNRQISGTEVAQLYAIESTPPLLFTQNLTNTAVLNGHDTNFTVVVSGPAPLSYQWYFTPAVTNNSGQADAYALTIAGIVYGVVVTNGGSGYGYVPNVYFVGGNPTTSAGGVAIVSNGIVTGIAITNAGLGYASTPAVVIGPPNGYLYGQTNNTLIISGASQSNVGNYYVVVSSTNASMTSSVVSLTILYPPSISMNPIGFTQSLHASQELTVYATGTSTLLYQWFLNSTNIVGATNSSYFITNLSLNQAGAYTVAVSNLYGYAISLPAYVDVAPTLTSPFSGATGLWGQNTTLGVGAVGSGSLSYQWYFNGVAITGATTNSYTIDGIQFTNAGLYSVVISSPYGSVTNTAYQVVVNPANTSLGIFPGVYITGTAGYSYTILSTTNLADTNAWVTLTNIAIPTTPYIWVDTATDTTLPGNPKKFYRVVAGQ